MKITIKEPHLEEEDEIIIDDWDLWSMDVTLSQIIHPMLVKFRENVDGSPLGISDERWKKILDEMIWSFNFILNEDSVPIHIRNDKQIIEQLQNGLNLFAKHFQSLWD